MGFDRYYNIPLDELREVVKDQYLMPDVCEDTGRRMSMWWKAKRQRIADILEEREKMIRHYYTSLPGDRWVNLFVHPGGDAMCEDGCKRDVDNTWWPDDNQPISDEDWDDRYNRLMNADSDSEKVDLDKMVDLIHEHIGTGTGY